MSLKKSVQYRSVGRVGLVVASYQGLSLHCIPMAAKLAGEGRPEYGARELVSDVGQCAGCGSISARCQSPSPCRTEEEERRDRKRYRHKARDARKKLQILQSLKEYVTVNVPNL